MSFRILLSSIALVIVSISVKSQTMGCTDIDATNFNAIAIINDGSCIYADQSISPDTSITLNPLLKETSGLLYWNNLLWTFNDNDDITLYGLDINSGEIVDSIELIGTQNVDWEAITQDDQFIYVGDFGNNSHGNRTDLKIYKIIKSSLLTTTPEVNIISFNYPEQLSFEPSAGNETDFDCEAMIVVDGQIYLFTKQWISSGTSVYSLPTAVGNYEAQLIETHSISGLITDAISLANKSLVILCGYNAALQPFVYLLYDFQSNDFFGANKRQIQLSLPFNQIEAITTIDGTNIFLTNEDFQLNAAFDFISKIHEINLQPYLGDYLLRAASLNKENDFLIRPNPFTNEVTIDLSLSASRLIKQIKIVNAKGDLLKSMNTNDLSTLKMDLSQLPSREYIVKLIGANYNKNSKLIKVNE